MCVETNSFTLDQICIESELAGEAECRAPQGNGCCVDSENSCTDDVSFEACTAQHWYEATACSAVAMCEPATSNLTDRIIIVLAILIVIVLLILFRRKRPD